MAYQILDLELSVPLPDLRLDHFSGVALIVRRKERVLGFLMKSLPAGAGIDRDEFARWIAGEIGTRWIQASLREELCPPSDTNGFPSLTVAVCTKDRSVCLRRCLLSLLELKNQTDPSASDFEILVVDNAPSDDQTKHVVSQLPGVNYVADIRPGLNFARNTALREAKGELLAYLDDDVVVDQFWLQGLQEAWSENPDAAAYTGQVLPLELETEAQIVFERRGGFRRGFEKVRYTPSRPSGDDCYLYPCRTGIFGVGCNMAFRRQNLLEIGGFDEALDTGRPLPGGGDHDIFYRVIRAGHVLVYEPRYLVFHQHRQTMEQLCRQYWTWGLTTMAFASKARRTDAALRSVWRKLIVLWFTSHLRELFVATFGRHCVPPRFLFWELVGGLVGLCGEYARSRRRTTQIRGKHQ